MCKLFKLKILLLTSLILGCNKNEIEKEIVTLNPKIKTSSSGNWVSEHSYNFNFNEIDRYDFILDRDTFEKGPIIISNYESKSNSMSKIFVNDSLIYIGQMSYWTRITLNLNDYTSNKIHIKHIQSYKSRDSITFVDSFEKNIYILENIPCATNYINKQFILYNIDDITDSIIFKRSLEPNNPRTVSDTLDINNCKYIILSPSSKYFPNNPFEFGFQTEYLNSSSTNDFYLKSECEKFVYRSAFFYLDEKDKNIAYLKTWKYNYKKYKEDLKIYKGRLR